MYMADARAVISSVIYGPDQRTRIKDDTRRVLFVTYAPMGVEEVALRHHLAQLEEHVRLFSPEAELEHVGTWGQ